MQERMELLFNQVVSVLLIWKFWHQIPHVPFCMTNPFEVPLLWRSFQNLSV